MTRNEPLPVTEPKRAGDGPVDPFVAHLRARVAEIEADIDQLHRDYQMAIAAANGRLAEAKMSLEFMTSTPRQRQRRAKSGILAIPPSAAAAELERDNLPRDATAPAYLDPSTAASPQDTEGSPE